MNLTASVLVAICVITSGVRAMKLDEVFDDYEGYFENTYRQPTLTSDGAWYSKITNKGKSISRL
jgi:hypothetical protein